MTPDEYCQQKAAASGSSFYYSFIFLPAERRRAITALYAFCREVDDVVDDSAEMQVAAAKLAWWRGEVANLERGNPQHPVTRALQGHKDNFAISAQRLNEIIDGMEMDLTQTRYLDWPGLERYCYLVAGVVGLLAAGIFGYRDARTLEYARRLGIAFQLTNIIRDVKEDARLNRIYIPLEDLERLGITPDIFEYLRAPAGELTQVVRQADPLAPHPIAARLRPAVEQLAERAREYYRSADQLLPLLDLDSQPAFWTLATIYRTLLEKIAATGYDVVGERKIRLTTPQKLGILGKGFARRLT
jgi:phytoene synthase